MSVRGFIHGYCALRGLLQGGRAMYFIWILIGMPIASLLCAAFIATRGGKTRPANTGGHRTHSASSVTALSNATNADDWKSESAVQVLIGILSKPTGDGFRVTYVAKSDDEPWTRSKPEVWALRRCTELSFIDKDSSPAEVGLNKGGSENPSSVK
jgi:hypothetical protein